MWTSVSTQRSRPTPLSNVMHARRERLRLQTSGLEPRADGWRVAGQDVRVRGRGSGSPAGRLELVLVVGSRGQGPGPATGRIQGPGSRLRQLRQGYGV
eukprot:1121300-Rhodomonas_salina.1